MDMHKEDMTQLIQHYIKTQGISIRQMVLDLNIEEDKLTGKSQEKLLATEFLSICQYLGIEPREWKYERTL